MTSSDISANTAAIVNVRESTIAREADCILPTYAGPEIGVASTKACTCQLTVLACLAIAAARARGAFDTARERALVTALTETPRHIAEILHLEPEIADVAHKIAGARDVLYLGRGVNFPIALEMISESHVVPDLPNPPIKIGLNAFSCTA